MAKRKSKLKNQPIQKDKVKKLRAQLSELKQQLSDQKRQFKQRTEEIQTSAYEHATHTILQAMEKKEEARMKVLNAADMQFEKEYNRKLSKKFGFMLPQEGGRPSTKTPKTTKKRRGRKPKNTSAASLEMTDIDIPKKS